MRIINLFSSLSREDSRIVSNHAKIKELVKT